MKKDILVIGLVILILTVTFSGCIDNESIKIYVDDDGNADYKKIQSAIDNASNGYTIFVQNGIYHETIIVNKSINLIGDDNEKTIINFFRTNNSSGNQVVLITANNCSLKNFKIIGTIDSSHISGINVKSSHNTISNNIVINNDRGIYINGESKNNNISMNVCDNNTYGIYLFVSYYSNVFNNIVIENFNGIRIINSKHNWIFRNIVERNQQGMIVCCGSENNMVYYNNFQQNYEWNAQDKLFNEWDNGFIGNYWDDYNGTDINNDGIGDIPYGIEPSFTINYDRFPLMEPIEI